MDKKFVIKKEDISHNVSVIRKKTHGAKIYAVIKGNAYGMGLLPFALSLHDCGVDSFAVTSLSDALILREAFPESDILLLTPCCTAGDAEAAVEADVSLSVGSLENARMISDIAKNLSKQAVIHIKIDTGMGRYGFLPDNIDDIAVAATLPCVNAAGIFTHLHSAFNKKESPSRKQFSIFASVISELEKKRISFPIRHICNSTAIFRFPEMHLTAVRAGSALIGRLPEICTNTGLKKVGELIGSVTDVRTLPKGSNIGYAALYRTKKSQRIACVNVGYCDGVAVAKAADTFRFIDILRYGFNDFKLLFKPAPVICKIKGKNAVALGRIGMTNLVLNADNISDVCPGDSVSIPVSPVYLSPLIERVYE